MPRFIVKKIREPTWLNAGARTLPIWQTRDAKSLLPHKLRLGQLHEIFRPINPLKIASEDPLTFSERPLDVQLIFLYAQKSTSRVHSDDTSGLSWNFLSKILSEFRN